MGFSARCSADSIWERAKQQAYKDGMQPSTAANHSRQTPAATKQDAHTRARHQHGSQPQPCRQPMPKRTQAARGAARPATSPSARQTAPSGTPAAAALPPPRKGRSFCCDLDLTFLEGVFGTRWALHIEPLVVLQVVLRHTQRAELIYPAALECSHSKAYRCLHPSVCRKTFTVFIPDAPCRLCGGLGKAAGQGCRPCEGRGKQQHERRVTLELGPSLVDGDTLKVPGKGYPARPGHPLPE